MKSQNALKTIGEVAKDLAVAPHVLRFWEKKFYQIKPIKRDRGRRYYRPEDVETLKTIQTLLHKERYTIKGAQKFLRDQKQAESLRLEDIVEGLVSLRDALSGVLQTGKE
ncbi:MAG: MerR family transcriptional regulator [Alphaproteobacteria bacterium]